MNRADEFYDAVEVLINLDIFPTPTMCNRAMGRKNRRRMNMLNGRETKIRRQVLLAHGFTYDEEVRRWSSPSS